MLVSGRSATPIGRGLGGFGFLDLDRTKDTSAVTPPIRTCIGCRGRDGCSAMLRVVAVHRAPAGASVEVHPDPRRGMPGRGAWLHLATRCLDLAERRRAFGRALRIPGRPDTGAVRAYVEAHAQNDHADPSLGSVDDEDRKRV